MISDTLMSNVQSLLRDWLPCCRNYLDSIEQTWESAGVALQPIIENNVQQVPIMMLARTENSTVNLSKKILPLQLCTQAEVRNIKQVITLWKNIVIPGIAKVLYHDQIWYIGKGVLFDSHKNLILCTTVENKKYKSRDGTYWRSEVPTLRISPLVFSDSDYAVWKKYIVNYFIPGTAYIDALDYVSNEMQPATISRETLWTMQISIEYLDSFAVKPTKPEFDCDITDLIYTSLPSIKALDNIL